MWKEEKWKMGGGARVGETYGGWQRHKDENTKGGGDGEMGRTLDGLEGSDEQLGRRRQLAGDLTDDRGTLGVPCPRFAVPG
ncbi:hypothetical protein DPEC_G00279540 [Dallia pectoralis]|uniref:Uncharacterized protein n=1 Tax=Dallia pectoralis TaxID=75939 RepID=A0ACC2FMF0_DALPE|nr:hypothetical protein DPEC_G00279540 [Dallia pectoralis]